MKYAIILIIILILIFVSIIILMKKLSNNTSISEEIITKEVSPTLEIKNNNPNPSFTISLLDYKKVKNNVFKSNINDILSFKKTQNKRIKVYNNSKYIGIIAIKDYKKFELIATNPEYFEGTIISKPDFNNYLKKVTIKVQVKKEYSKQVYKINNEYLNKLVSLQSLFEINQIIETNYGPSTIQEILKDHLIVEVPSLGKREIYDIKNIIK